MSEQNLGSERTDVEAPPLKRRFVMQMAALAIVTSLLQVGLFAFMPEGSWSVGRAALPISRNPYGYNPGETVLPGNSVVWQEAVWVSVTQGTSMMSGVASRAATAKLVAIDVKSGKPRDTGIILSPSPLGLVIVGDELWAVSENVVYCVLNDRAIQRNPRRTLIQPTKPFVYQDRMAVIDKNLNDVYTLLTFNDGEWLEVERVEAPIPSPASSWYKPELRVLSDRESLHLFFSDGTRVYYRKEIAFSLDAAFVSALHPENAKIPLALDNSSGVGARWQPPQIAQQLSGWSALPIILNWNDTWEVACINTNVYAFASSNNSSTIQQFKFQSGIWVKSSALNPQATTTLSVASGSPGYFVGDNLNLFATDGSTNVEHITTGMRLTDNTRYVVFVFAILSRYFTAMSLLCVGTWWLMRVHRSPHYLYGKRTVIQASVLHRGIARGIDSVITVYPPLFWLIFALQSELDFTQTFPATGFPNVYLFTIFSIFGTWIGGILVLSFAEGSWGVTPGKWICGIRTFRTTLRPCGMLRALARELMIYPDTLLLVTGLPAVLSIAFTKNWQRLGDITADTIVVINPNRQSWLR